MKLKFQPKIEFGKLDLLLIHLTCILKKKKNHMELECGNLEFHLKKNLPASTSVFTYKGKYIYIYQRYLSLVNSSTSVFFFF